MGFLLAVLALGLMFLGRSSNLGLVKSLDALELRSVASQLYTANQLLSLGEILLLLLTLACSGEAIPSAFQSLPLQVWQTYALASLLAGPLAYLGGMVRLAETRVSLASSSADSAEIGRLVVTMNQSFSCHIALAVVGPLAAIVQCFTAMKFG